MEIADIIIISLIILSTLVEMIYYSITGTSVLRRNRKSQKNTNATSALQPPVSVIICAKNEEENLKNFLPLVLEQDYPEFEVIIVNDGSEDRTISLIRRFQKDYPNLYLTTLPTAVRIVSHKKLAITVGIKAAKHEILLFTDADCRPYSRHWISTMAKNFNEETEFVLGYGGYYRNGTFAGLLTAYDSLTIAIQYLGFAAMGKPYMGVGRNMAYRKSTFFRVKGFAGFLNIASGDDDLIVNRFGNSKNTVGEVDLEAKTLSLPQSGLKDWYYQKTRHLSTSGIYSRHSKLLLGIEPFFRGLFYASLLACILVGNHNYYTISIAIICFIFKIGLQTIIVNKTAKMYKERQFNIFAVLLFDVILPLFSLYTLTIGRLFNMKRKFVWR